LPLLNEDANIVFVMTNKQQKAFDELKAIGCPVFKRKDDEDKTFHISGEDNHSSMWADYYDDYLNPIINRILSKYDLIAEWEDAGSMTVWE